MKKRLKALLMALVMMITTVITSVSGNVIKANAATDPNYITVNFHFSGVSSNDYSDYRLWLWTIGDGSEHFMTAGTDEATYSYKTEAATLKLGFVVKKGEGWEGKDYADDRFVDLSKVISGTVDVNVTSGKGEFTTDTTNAVLGTKVTAAKSEDYKTIAVTLSSNETLSSDMFTLRDTTNNTDVAIKSITGSNTDFVITPENDLDRLASYEITYKGNTFMVGMPDYYSTSDFENQYTYTGDDLGATYSKESTTFRVWAPLATSVKVNLYASGTKDTDDQIGESVAMTASEKGTWVATIPGDLNGKYYTYTAVNNGVETKDIIDPYARTCGVNGNRGMIIDLSTTNPEGWDSDKLANPAKNYTDAMIYELHIRDFSYEDCSGMLNKGKYLAFTEKGTKNSYGQSTGVDYLKDLGITYVHLMPTFDYASVDETKLDQDKFNWGYDPQNFNIPEGSYSTDPYHGEVRVNEFKQMVQALHNANIGVVMDVVYGHVNAAGSFSINQLTPNYYTRPGSNGSGCGNDTATARKMNSKYITDSMVYWAKEYHVDGFRVDQQGLFDVDTINNTITELRKVNPNIIFYGEGWSTSTIPTKDGLEFASQGNADLTPLCAYFNDGVRDSLKGGVFDTLGGYVTKNFTKVAGVISGVIASPGWELEPTQVVNYNSCHDNYTLFDRISLTEGNEEATFEQKVKQNNLAAAIVYTSQGVTLMQAGEELLRTKTKEDGTFEGNSYASPSSLNSIKWDDLNKAEYQSTYNYYKGLIAFRKAHAGLRMPTAMEVTKNLKFILQGQSDDSAIAYTINGGANGEASDGITVIYNPSDIKVSVDLPEGDWDIFVKDDKAGNEKLGSATGKVEVNPTSTMVLVKGNRVNPDGTISDAPVNGNGTNGGNDAINGTNGTNGTNGKNESIKTGDSVSRYIALLSVVVLAAVAVTVLSIKKRKEFN